LQGSKKEDMQKAFKRHLVTAALPYANGPVHIGHLAGVYVPADIYVRYLRLKGEDVLFICGSDEHGVPITIKARHEQVKPQVPWHDQGCLFSVWHNIQHILQDDLENPL
jgi:methionyl-tRNA synthetase